MSPQLLNFSLPAKHQRIYLKEQQKIEKKGSTYETNYGNSKPEIVSSLF